jgi:hypothetical protein
MRTTVRASTQCSGTDSYCRRRSRKRGSSSGAVLLLELVLLLDGGELSLGRRNIVTRRLISGLTRLHDHAVVLLGNRERIGGCL